VRLNWFEGLGLSFNTAEGSNIMDKQEGEQSKTQNCLKKVIPLNNVVGNESIQRMIQ
jgi:hypothetical protein